MYEQNDESKKDIIRGIITTETTVGTNVSGMVPSHKYGIQPNVLFYNQKQQKKKSL